MDCYEEDQGFLDASGRYLNRKQALHRATATGQVKDLSKIRMDMCLVRTSGK